jgi:Domain of Unknown Function with PDB structure (DUF3857)
MKHLITIIFVISIYMVTNAQKAPIKFGKVKIEDLQKEYHEIDSSAAAIVICDFGTSNFEYTEAYGFRIVFNRLTRIKILNEQGLEYANFKIPLYKNNSDKEEINTMKGFTYNIVNGAIEKEKLTKESKYREDFSDSKDYYIVSFPKVKNNSIIEIEYTIRSPFIFNLQGWYFQYDIPALHSEYRVEILEYFNYKKQFKGYEPLAVSNEEKANGVLRFRTSSKPGNGIDYKGGQRQSSELIEVNYNSTKYQWISKNVPAFVQESFLNSSENYISKVEFELASTQYPNSILKDYSRSWVSINKELHDNVRFGKVLNRKYYSKIIEELNIKDSLPLYRIDRILRYVQNKTEWNGKNRILTTENKRNIFESQNGNSADINIALVGLLRELGFDANPVVISTRSNGIIQPGQPMISAFNYVIAEVKVEGKQYLLDATDNNSGINILPFRCLNDKGRIVNNKGGEWIELKNRSIINQTKTNNYKIEEDKVIGNTVIRNNENSAYNLLKKHSKFSSTEEYIDNVEKNNIGLSIFNYDYKIEDSINYMINETFEFEVSNAVTIAGDMIYFNPLLSDGIKENPFKLEERKYPVDFPNPIKRTIVNQFEIPEGYVVEELPEPIKVAVPDNGGYYIYNIQQIQNQVQLVSKFAINKSMFYSEDYQYLKQFYEMVVEKNKSQIVLKKEI